MNHARTNDMYSFLRYLWALSKGPPSQTRAFEWVPFAFMSNTRVWI